MKSCHSGFLIIIFLFSYKKQRGYPPSVFFRGNGARFKKIIESKIEMNIKEMFYMGKLTLAREGQVKTLSIKTRVSEEEKQMIHEYCGKHDISVSDFIRNAINAALKEN